jgi:hypothetical protein
MSRIARALAPVSVLLAAVLGSSCKDRADDGPGEAPAPRQEPAGGDETEPPAAPPTTPAARKGPRSFEGFDLAPLQERLRGSFLFSGGSYHAAWSIADDGRARVFERGFDKRMTLEFAAPCIVRMTEHMEGGARAGTSRRMTFVGDDLVFGPPLIGVRDGDRVAVCTDEDVYLHDGESCALWRLDTFDHGFQPPREAKCGPSGEDGSLFTVTDAGDNTVVLEADGELLRPRGSELERAQRRDSHEEAVKALPR